MARLILQILLFLICIPAASAADRVKIRAGEHKGYSRLVFDWSSESGYDIKSQPGKLVLTFKKNADLDRTALKEKIGENISGLEVVSNAPLTVALSIPQGSKVRDFQAGNRIMVDIYDSTEKPAAAPSLQKAEAPVPAPLKDLRPQAGPENKPAAAGPPPRPQSKIAFGPTMPQKPRRVEPEIVNAAAPDSNQLAAPKKTVNPILPAKQAAVPADQLMGPPRTIRKIPEPAVISMSSIDSIDLAVFERGHKIWMVSHLQNLTLRPQVSGPDSQKLLPLSVDDKNELKTFQFTLPPQSILRAQGGGVLWRIIVAAPENILPGEKNKPVAPVIETKGAVSKLLWPLKEIGRLAEIVDPVTGRLLKVITVKSAEQFSGPAYNYTEFETLPSPLGLVILPKVDDLQVNIGMRGVEISRPGGLTLVSSEESAAIMTDRSKQKKRPQVDPAARRIFDFNEWQMGPLSMLDQNTSIILGSLPKRPPSEKIEGILSLGKMYLSHGRWAEALGFLNFAERDVPELAQNPEFIALRGAGQALGRESEQAFNALSSDALKIFPEIDYWRAYSLATLGDWQQAAEIAPADLGILADYPPALGNRLSLVLTEIALREGDVKKGAALLNIIQEEKDVPLPVEQKAAFDYLKGELARQEGKIDETKKLWEPLTKGPDKQFATKAGVAMARLLAERKEITPQQTIDRLEHLRYTWRGDELEAQVNYWLGHTYFENGDYVKGLKIMRDAAGYAAGTDMGDMIAAEMSRAFTDLYLSKKLEKVSAIDAAVIYDEFAELLPPGEKGDRIASQLIDHLVKYDLYEQAQTILQNQLDRRLQGLAAYNAGIRLGAIYLLDKKPVNAITALNKAAAHLQKLSPEQQTPERLRKLALLRARAFSEQNKPDEALAQLAGLADAEDVSRLRGDIAWRASYWDDAAESLGEVLVDQDISTTKPPSQEDTALILRYAVALNLSNDRIALSNLREKYGSVMAQSDKSRVFEMVTRSWQTALLQDRQALMAMVSEVDLFDEFLNKSGDAAPSQSPTPAAAENAAPVTPAPAVKPAAATAP